MVRVTVAVVVLATSLPAAAGEMTAGEARSFVVGNAFSYACSDHTRGNARVDGDGSVIGSIQPQGVGPVRYGMMPPGTLRVEGERICASLRGSLMQPCFYLERIDADSFRGSVWGFGLAYCDFTRLRGHVRDLYGER